MIDMIDMNIWFMCEVYWDGCILEASDTASDYL